MAKVTEKLRITLPKAIATQLGVGSGTELVVDVAGEVTRLRPIRAGERSRDRAALVQDFDSSTERQNQRDAILRERAGDLFEGSNRRWRRAELNEP